MGNGVVEIWGVAELLTESQASLQPPALAARSPQVEGATPGQGFPVPR